MVPNGWDSKTLVKLLDKIIDYRGQSVPKASSGIPLITAKNVRDGYLDFSSQEYVDESKFEEWMSRGIPSKGDILFTTEAPLGKACRFPNEGQFAVGQRTVTLRTSDRLDSEFLLYTLLSERGQRLIDIRSSGSTAKGIKSSELKKVKISYPESLPEQRKIAKILSTWDKAITTTEKLIETSKQQKKALMQQLLTGKKRLVNPETGKVFEGEWTYKTINEVATRIQKKSDGEAHPILTISSLSGFVTQEDRYSRYMAGESVKNYILLKRGEFAYNKGNSKTYQFGCIFDLESFDTGLVPHVYVCFKLNTGLNHRYFKYLFEADYLKPQLGALVNTGVRNNGLLNIKPTEFMNTKVPVPCFGEQERIADVLHASSENLKILNAKLAHFKQEKKALMQQLLTGKRRVKVDEEVTA